MSKFLLCFEAQLPQDNFCILEHLSFSGEATILRFYKQYHNAIFHRHTSRNVFFILSTQTMIIKKLLLYKYILN